MIITQLGMSGVGKTYWSKQLERQGFERFCADDYIEDRLGQELSAQGYKGISGVAEWMGQPYEQRYARTSQRYLGFERDAMLELISRLGRHPGTHRDLVIDTTGSVIYLPGEILRALSKHTAMVYFHTPTSAHAELARQYLLDPKPVIWGDAFTHLPGETEQQAIARCYPRLLRDRTAKYQRLAQVTFDYPRLRYGAVTAQTIIDRAAGLARA